MEFLSRNLYLHSWFLWPGYSTWSQPDDTSGICAGGFLPVGGIFLALCELDSLSLYVPPFHNRNSLGHPYSLGSVVTSFPFPGAGTGSEHDSDTDADTDFDRVLIGIEYCSGLAEPMDLVT